MKVPYHNDRGRTFNLYSEGVDLEPDPFDDYPRDPPSTKTELAITTTETESRVEFCDPENGHAWIQSTVWYDYADADAETDAEASADD